MAKVATTFRIDPVVKAGLSRLSKLRRKSLNHLANEAIKEYVARRTVEIEHELEATLEDLRAYRRSDPDFARAIAAAVDAEVAARHDPAEGRVVEDAGRAESVVRDLLNE